MPGVVFLNNEGKNTTGRSYTFEEPGMKVTEKGQVTVPIEIRRKLGILPNTEVEFIVSGKNAILRKVAGRQARGKKVIEALRGRATAGMSTDEIMALTRGE
jgi:AbrB family looped-hinge helix DNA binding protein